MMNKTLAAVAWAAAVAVLAACGGSGGGTAGIDRTGTPTPVAIAAYGTITAFGSVVVNGVRYDTATAQFTVDDSPGSQSDLAVGDVVLVRGTTDASSTAGTATSVVFDDQVQGPIASIDAVARTFVVLGQTVRVGADTSFDDRIQPASLAGLAVGALVEVSGFAAADGSIHASRIEPKLTGTELELTGVVANHDGVARRFAINAQVVDYSAVGQLRDFPAGGIANGQTVEVKGGSIVGGVWRPVSIEWQANGLTGAAGERREVEGLITGFASAVDFTVAGLAVTTNAQTVFTGGAAADLGVSVKVEVEGTLNGAGVLVATKVDIRRSSAVRVAALVDSVDAGAGSFVVLGITVRVDALTRLEDKSSQQQRPFGLANLFSGNYVEVRGVELPAGSGEILAALVEREDLDPDTELQGLVQVVTRPSFMILGVTIDTDGGTAFRDVSDAPITASQFFTEIAPGDLVKAKGVEIATRVLGADEVEFEN
jgi:hypothetical protein